MQAGKLLRAVHDLVLLKGFEDLPGGADGAVREMWRELEWEAGGDGAASISVPPEGEKRIP
jgi:hypothetical protein